MFTLHSTKFFLLRSFLKRNIIFGIFYAAMLALALGQFFTGNASAGQEAEYEIKFGTIVPDNTPWANHLKKMKERIEKESAGRIKVKTFLGGALGGEVEIARSLRRGRLQAYAGTCTAVAEAADIPELQLFDLPYLFDSLEEADYILDKVVFEDFQKILKAKGFYLAYWHENGWRNFASKKIAIHTPADLAKQKMRSQESNVHLAMWRALGVQAESIPVPEVMGALQTGMVDGFDMTTLFTSATGWYEGIEHYTISQHIYQPGLIIYSLQFIESLPKDLQKIVIGNRAEEMAWGRNAVREMSEPLIQNFKDEGIKVYELTAQEKAVFKEILLPMHKDFEKIVGKELLEKVYNGKKEFASKSSS
ncbi:MAG: C4-dicarboxylate ABC transporter substrate-binding protein [Desulfobacterium sp.]|nr:C4-dicarboxylate ABC transporter substrate-binding protein [Desulfobacterium sp.]